jgi:hypothetical protein
MDPLSQLSITVGGVDLAIIAAYLVVVFLAGVLLTRMASTDIDSYFLTGAVLDRLPIAAISWNPAAKATA